MINDKDQEAMPLLFTRPQLHFNDISFFYFMKTLDKFGGAFTG